MADYVKRTWVDGETPVNAENLNHMENGIAANAAEATKLSEEIADINGQLNWTDIVNINQTSLESGGLNYVAGLPDVNSKVMRANDYISVEPNTLYQIYSERDNREDTHLVFQYDSSLNFINYTSSTNYYQTGLTTTEDCRYLRYRTQTEGTNDYTLPPLDTRIMVEKGSVKTFAFDGYKKTIGDIFTFKAKDLLIQILRRGVYDDDTSTKISELEEMLK